MSKIVPAEDDIDDASSVASSSVNSVVGKVNATADESKEEIPEKVETGESLKDRVLKEVMEEVMPDTGDYDIDGMMASRSEPSKSCCIRMLKILGILDMELHDAVLTGSLYHVQRSMNKINFGKNADPAMMNQYDRSGQTPLSLACKINQEPLSSTLLDGNALPDIGDELTGRTPLMYAVLNKNHEMIKRLVIAGASVSMCDFQCITPMMLACANGDLTSVKIFCNKMADVDDQDENGWTALHYCSKGNAVKVIRFLIYEEGADRHLKDYKKRKPVDIAKFLDHGDCVAVLQSSASL